MQQVLAFEGGGGEYVPGHHEGGPTLIDDTVASDPSELEQVVVGGQPQLEVRRPESQVEERPWVTRHAIQLSGSAGRSGP
jgi:hypothetical protein